MTLGTIFLIIALVSFIACLIFTDRDAALKAIGLACITIAMLLGRIALIALFVVLIPSMAWGQQSLTVAYHGKTRDMVGGNRNFGPNGFPDHTFSLVFSGAANNIIRIHIRADHNTGTWDTSPPYAIIAVTPNASAPPVNNLNGINYLASSVFVYLDYDLIIGRLHTFEVTFADGTTVTNNFALPVSPSPIPTTPVVVSCQPEILFPKNKSTISGMTVIRAHANCNQISIIMVSLTLNDIPLLPVRSTGMFQLWETREVPNGTYKFIFSAYDANKNVYTTEPHFIMVNNPVVK